MHNKGLNPLNSAFKVVTRSWWLNSD